MTTHAPEAISIRPAERADLLAVYRIERISFPQPWPFRALEGFLGRPGFLVAVGGPGVASGSTGGATSKPPAVEIRGYVVADVATEFGRTIGHVKDLAVAPGWRGRGIGSRLLDRALSVLVTNGARRAKLEVRVDNHAARSLYADFGFTTKQVVPGYYDDGEDALLLVASLAERDRVDDR